jgi:hypothetical protein
MHFFPPARSGVATRHRAHDREGNPACTSLTLLKARKVGDTPVRRRSFTLARHEGRRPLALCFFAHGIRPAIFGRPAGRSSSRTIQRAMGREERFAFGDSPASPISALILCGQVCPLASMGFGITSPRSKLSFAPALLLPSYLSSQQNSVGCCCHGTFNLVSSLRLGSLGSFLVLECWDGYGRAGLEKPFHRKR